MICTAGGADVTGRGGRHRQGGHAIAGWRQQGVDGYLLAIQVDVRALGVDIVGGSEEQAEVLLIGSIADPNGDRGGQRSAHRGRGRLLCNQLAAVEIDDAHAAEFRGGKVVAVGVAPELDVLRGDRSSRAPGRADVDDARAAVSRSERELRIIDVHLRARARHRNLTHGLGADCHAIRIRGGRVAGGPAGHVIDAKAEIVGAAGRTIDAHLERGLVGDRAAGLIEDAVTGVADRHGT